MLRKCKNCNKEIEVNLSHVTKILCSDCCEKNKGYVKEKRNYDTEVFIFCRICNHVGKNLILHIKNKHGLSSKEYLEEFPNSPLMSKQTLLLKTNRSQESRNKTGEKSRAAWKKEDYREKQSKRNRYGHFFKMSKEGIENIKKGQNNSVLMQARREKKKQNEILRYEQERKEKIELKEFVICPLCIKDGKDEIDSRFKFISFGHLKSHEYNTEQFKEDFPLNKLKIDSLCKEHSKKLSGEKHFNFGKHLDFEIQKNISLGVKNTWDEYNKTKKCVKCGKRIMASSSKELCNKCYLKTFSNKDTFDKVFCRICNQSNSNLTNHIKIEHKMSVEDYKKQFKCEVISKKTKLKMSSKKNNNPMTEEAKQKLKIYNKEKKY